MRLMNYSVVLDFSVSLFLFLDFFDSARPAVLSSFADLRSFGAVVRTCLICVGIMVGAGASQEAARDGTDSSRDGNVIRSVASA